MIWTRADRALGRGTEGIEGEGNGDGFPSPVDYGVWGSRGHGRAQAKNGFGTFLASKNTHMMATNCLEYGITVNNIYAVCTTVYTGIEKGTRMLTLIASTGGPGVRAYYGGQSRGCTPSGV